MHRHKAAFLTLILFSSTFSTACNSLIEGRINDFSFSLGSAENEEPPSDDPQPVVNKPPVITVAAFENVEAKSGDIDIVFSLFDPELDPIDIVSIDYAVGDDVYLPASVTGVLGNLSSSSVGTGASHSLVWNSGQDLGCSLLAGARLRIRVEDQSNNGSSDEVEILLQNNTLPTAVIMPLQQPLSDPVVVSFNVGDVDNDLLSLIDAEFSVNNGETWQSADVEGLNGLDLENISSASDLQLNWSNAPQPVGDVAFVLSLSFADGCGAVEAQATYEPPVGPTNVPPSITVTDAYCEEDRFYINYLVSDPDDEFVSIALLNSDGAPIVAGEGSDPTDGIAPGGPYTLVVDNLTPQCELHTLYVFDDEDVGEPVELNVCPCCKPTFEMVNLEPLGGTCPDLMEMIICVNTCGNGVDLEVAYQLEGDDQCLVATPENPIDPFTEISSGTPTCFGFSWDVDADGLNGPASDAVIDSLKLTATDSVTGESCADTFDQNFAFENCPDPGGPTNPGDPSFDSSSAGTTGASSVDF